MPRHAKKPKAAKPEYERLPIVEKDLRGAQAPHPTAAGVDMNVLALERIESGVETFEPKRHESRGMRFVAFNRWLECGEDGYA